MAMATPASERSAHRTPTRIRRLTPCDRLKPLADVDDERAFDWRGVEPLSSTVLHLQTREVVSLLRKVCSGATRGGQKTNQKKSKPAVEMRCPSVQLRGSVEAGDPRPTP